MKAAAFEYVRARSIDEVCRLLAGSGDSERKIIAGGQTLVPLMAMRLARPDMLIDINDLDELDFIRDDGNSITIGAMTRQRTVEQSALVADKLPLLSRAIRHVGHQQTRNRGTIGGSIVHGDPSAEIPLAALALDATLVFEDTDDKTERSIHGFFEAAMVTNIRSDQLLTAVRFPVPGHARTGCSFHEISSREGDFAIVAAAAQVGLGDDDTVAHAAVVVGGANPAPTRLHDLESVLIGTRASPETLEVALERMELSPDTDVHATAGYRYRVAGRLVIRAINEALELA